MSVLVDTSVWSDHFRKPSNVLSELLVLDLVFTHPMIIGEMACGTPPEPRLRTLEDIELLLPANQATPSEVRNFIESEKLFGIGCGLVELTLLASTLITPGATLWSLDKRLSSLSNRFGVCFALPVH
jgi:predicted nucleic acid-binding protein